MHISLTIDKNKFIIISSINLEWKKKIIVLAKSLGWNVYKNLGNNYVIEVPIKDKKFLLKEERLNKWLLISNEMPQVILETEEASKLIEKIRDKP
jgi:hypothetical protein